MSTHDIDTLTKQLEELRLEQADAIKHLKQINEAEGRTLERLAVAQAKAPKKGDCPFVIGDTLRITNRLRTEHGIVGMVRKVSNTRVTIRNTITGNEYQRAWWNLELVESATKPHTKKNRVRK